MRTLLLTVVAAIFLVGCATDRTPPDTGRSRLCCGGELWQYQ
jgi:hypothetical protein